MPFKLNIFSRKSNQSRRANSEPLNDASLHESNEDPRRYDRSSVSESVFTESTLVAPGRPSSETERGETNFKHTADTGTLRPSNLVIRESPPPYTQKIAQEPLFPELPSDYTDPNLASEAELLIASLPAKVWIQIAALLSPICAANLALTCKTLRYRLGAEPWKALDKDEHVDHRTQFLLQMDRALPFHLFCFLCSRYHLRTHPGSETLEHPENQILNPVFICPNRKRIAPLLRMRLTDCRTLPFHLVQLVMRSHNHLVEHGIKEESLSRRPKCRNSNWSHETRAYIYKGHLLFRLTSTCFVGPNLTPNQQRLLIYSRADYTPYFSVCAHWENDNFVRYVRCALSHVPIQPESVYQQLRKAPRVSMSKVHPNQLPKLCDNCRPMRRCPKCPTEYLIELKLLEDKQEKDPFQRFKHAICVSRWSDLGDGSSPFTSPEWVACNGQGDLDSFKAVKNASLCSIFEAGIGHDAPGQRMLPLADGFGYY